MPLNWLRTCCAPTITVFVVSVVGISVTYSQGAFEVQGGPSQGRPMRIQKGPGGAPQVVPTPGGPQGVPGQPGRPGQPPGTPQGPPGGGPPGAAGKPEAGAKPEGPPANTKRDEEPPAPPDPRELAVRPDPDGKLQFSFRNQRWPSLMEWLADVSQLPLDWQELPSGFVNIASPGRYTLAETRDLFNRHLLQRGFTMLELDGGLTVVKTEGINPALVPRVNAQDLQALQPHTFVRVSLDCGWLLAPKMAEELKPMVSGNGQLVSLEQTNRLEAMDAAINLQEIADLLREELSMDARGDLAREFELRYIPADEAKDMLSSFLGLKSDPKPTAPMSPQQARQMQMMQQQMMAQGGGQPVPQQAGQKQPSISIVVNARRNSVLINAPPDRLAIAAQFIRQIDVPDDSLQSLTDIENRIQVFRLMTLDPERLAEIVRDMNVLEPGTRLRVDAENKALIVSGSAADRYIIQSITDRLDGSARKFEVLQLRRLDAREVAESIQFLMGVEDDNRNSRNRNPFSFGFFGNNNRQESNDRFRVAANVRYRQVLLWANDSEMEEVRNLLIKLGELPPEGGNRSRRRVIEASSIPETLEYLQRIQATFNSTNENPIELPPAEAFVDPLADIANDRIESDRAPEADADSNDTDAGSEGAEEDADALEASEPEVGSDAGGITDDDIVRDDAADSRPLRWVTTQRNQSASEQSRDASDPENTQTREEAPGREDFGDIRSGADFDARFGPRASSQQDNPNAGAPIRVELDEDGNLILSSDDTAALDRLESLMMETEPPKRPYTIFKVKQASAVWMTLNLEDYFEEEDEDQNNGFPFIILGLGGSNEDEPEGLGKANELRFIPDNDTGTIVVTGATTAQLQTIAELIELWDVPDPLEEQLARYTRLVPVQYSRASKVAETIKEAYRDLLSSNDKAFSGGAPGGGGGGNVRGGGGGEPRNRERTGGGLVNASDGKDSGPTNFSFKGKLSIGVDEVGNTLLVSAEGEQLLELICKMIDEVDRAAQPQGSMQIRELPATINVEALERALSFLDSGDQDRPKPNEQQPQPQANPAVAPPPQGQFNRPGGGGFVPNAPPGRRR